MKMNRDDVYHALYKQGFSLKSWCEANRLSYRTAIDVVRGVSQARYGKGREIAEKLTKLVRGAA